MVGNLGSKVAVDTAPELTDLRGARRTWATLESAKIRCPRGHWFNGPIESLTVPEQPAATPPPVLITPRSHRSAPGGTARCPSWGPGLPA
jgi:hypothetical protein